MSINRRNITQKIAFSFIDSEREDVLQYMEWLRSVMDDLCQGLRRTVALMVILMAAFELVVSSKNSAIVIGSFRIANGSITIVFIPALVSFLFLQAINDTARLRVLQQAFTKSFSIWSPKAEKNDLDVLVYPSQALYWTIGSGGRSENEDLFGKLRGWLFTILASSIMFAVLYFDDLAYRKLYLSYLHDLQPWAISASIAAFCAITALVQFLSIPYQDRWRPGLD